MKIPDYLNKESTHKTNTLNTMTLTGLSLLWGCMLGLLSPWWNIGTVIFLMSGYGSEINKRKEEEHVRL